MSASFLLNTLPAPAVSERRRVLVTGAAGRIGSYFAKHAHEKYSLLLLVRPEDEGREEIEGLGEIVEGDVTDLARMKEICRGVDTILHLAANASPSATWTSVRDLNIGGTYNMFVAAKSAGCRRVVYASSIHAVSGYRKDVQVKESDPVNPGDLYGVSKCFGEALARYMAEQEGVSAIAIRIGAFQPLKSAENPHGFGMMDAFVSERDLQQLMEKCIDTEHIQFAILHGLSGNLFQRMDIQTTQEITGYQPQDDFTQLNPTLAALRLRETVDTHSLKDYNSKSGLRDDL